MTLKTIQPSEYYDQDYDGRIPVFRPTMAEFEDFYAFMEAIDSYGKEAGIVKVIPPKEWTLKLPSINKQLEQVRVRNPIIQHIIGCQGIYQQTNVEKRRPYTLAQWHALCQQTDHKPPDLTTTRTSQSVSRKRRRSNPSQPLPDQQQQQQQERQQQNQQKGPSRPPPSANTRSRSSRSIRTVNSIPPANNIYLHTPPPSPDILKRTKREIQADEIAQAQSNDPVPLMFDLHGHNEHLYTSDYCKELERIYWRNLTFTQPMYGADMSGTLFSDSVKSWNVNHLDNILNQVGVTLPGVNTPYLYFGMWKSTFPWHVEDLDLYSINYLHFGAPKQWYAIPGSYNKKFESVMQTTFFQQSKACSEFLRHKTQIASPHFLANSGIPVHRCVQHEGEFMITFPFGYHSGYNLGFNCAESVNFALSSWLDIGRQAKSCKCISDSVTIDMTIFNAMDSSTHHEQQQDDHRSNRLSATLPLDTTTVNGTSKKRRKATNALPTQSMEDITSCVFCTSHYPTDTELDDGRMVHRLCAESIPETYLEQVNDEKWVVRGITSIPPARWKLSCLFCRKTKGACMQCCYGKCCRSFHASCAKEAGATMERTLDQDQDTLVYDVYCPQHDPKLQEKKKLEKQEYAKKMVQVLSPGKSVYAKWTGSEMYKGVVEEHLIQRSSSRVRFEDGISRIVTWKNIRLDS
ncbi:JmjC domain, hydroxylase-domain-containing protein [Absidia repens]|uniref:[histone H3]-trimethyl-L-lysine(9) demethylase n=1 Tax=Absidia repens TaxID=90262 RepID=A0A1X2IZD0_9FUNG|nr:JmjC domain, hydroxylase-domain-containing protein [Absidia repens]